MTVLYSSLYIASATAYSFEKKEKEKPKIITYTNWKATPILKIIEKAYQIIEKYCIQFHSTKILFKLPETNKTKIISN